MPTFNLPDLAQYLSHGEWPLHLQGIPSGTFASGEISTDYSRGLLEESRNMNQCKSIYESDACLAFMQAGMHVYECMYACMRGLNACACVGVCICAHVRVGVRVWAIMCANVSGCMVACLCHPCLRTRSKINQ